jgi:hypothetical protein
MKKGRSFNLTAKLNNLLGKKIYSQLYLSILFLSFPFLSFFILIVDSFTLNITGIFPLSILILTLGPFAIFSLIFLVLGYLKAIKENSHVNKQIAAFSSVFVIMGLIFGIVGFLFVSLIE